MGSKAFRALLDLAAVEAARERFESFLSPDPNTGCLLWTGSGTKDGYGQFRFGGVIVMAHRFALVLKTGRVLPEGVDVDHRCEVRACMDHLEAVTHAENIRRRGPGKDNCVAARAALAEKRRRLAA